MSITANAFYFILGLICVHNVVCSSPLPSGSGMEDPDWEDPSPEEGPFLEGDIVTGSETIPVAEFKPSHRVLAANPRLLWPQKTLYYEFSSGQFRGDLRTLVEDALQDIMEQSCVRFSPRGQQTTYLKLKETGKGCNSKVGYPEEEGALTLQVAGRKCHTLGTVQHEFLHALGLWHEHTRADRDDFVAVMWDNVRPDRKSNFVKRNDEESVELLKLPYDYGSIMHYKTSSFTKHRGTSTLVPRHKEAVKVMGQRVGITKGDISKLNRLYNCTGKYYVGDDLEGKKFLLGSYYKSGVNSTSDFGEELDFRSDKQKIGVTSNGYRKKGISGVEDISLVWEGNTNEGSHNSGSHNITKYEIIRLKEVEKHKAYLHEVLVGTNRSASSEEFGRYSSENTTGPIAHQKIISGSDPERSSDKFASYFESNHSDTVPTKTTTGKVISEKELHEYEMRGKRETPGLKSQRDGNTETTDQQSREHHGSFAPQKILPELLKGVLNNDNDRPIVIQFAIYQPIVYKSSNQSESSTDDRKDTSNLDEGNGKEYRSTVDERRAYEARNSEIKRDSTDNRRKAKPVKSFQTEQQFSQEHEDSSIASNKNTFSGPSTKRQHGNDDITDGRHFNDGQSRPREQKLEYNRKTEYEYDPRTPTHLSEDHYPEHQTEYVPLSDDHEITVSRKEYTVPPHDFHVNGQELRVSQTSYKIESKNPRNPKIDISLPTGHLSQSEERFKSTEVDKLASSDVQRPEPSYSHEEKEYTPHSSEKAYIQSHKSFQKENGYESSSLIHLSQGKRAKSTNERENNNNFRNQRNDQNLSDNHREEETLTQQPPLELKQDHHAFSHDSHQSHYKAFDDIAPDFHEPVDDQLSQPTTSRTQILDAEKEEDIHKVIGYPTSRSGEVVGNLESHKTVRNDEESYVYDSKSSDTVSRTPSSTRANIREETLDETPFRDITEGSSPNKNKPFDGSRRNDDRGNEPISAKKPSRIRNEEVLSLNTRIQEAQILGTEKTLVVEKKRSRPDIVIEEDLSSELDIGERRKKLGNMDQKSDDTLKIGYTKRPDQELPNRKVSIRNKNRIQSMSNTKSTVVRKKAPDTRIEAEDQQELYDEEDLISKPQTSKLNLNPRQALPLKTSVNMGRKTFEQS